MNYTQEEFSNAVVITNRQYCNLIDEGQTRVDEDGNYKMYSSSEGKLYCVEGNLFN